MKEMIVGTVCIIAVIVVNTFIVASDPSVDDAVRSGIPAMIGWLFGRMFGGKAA